MVIQDPLCFRKIRDSGSATPHFARGKRYSIPPAYQVDPRAIIRGVCNVTRLLGRLAGH